MRTESVGARPEAAPRAAHQRRQRRTSRSPNPGAPSTGRPFTAELLTCLVNGVAVAPLVLHTGVASLEAEELPYPERFRVPAATADQVDATRPRGGRLIAAGTTVVRALESESAVGDGGLVQPRESWTDLIVTSEHGVRAVDGLLTGWHEPASSHLLLLEAVAGRPMLEWSYAASLAEHDRWHELGDVHLSVLGRPILSSSAQDERIGCR